MRYRPFGRSGVSVSNITLSLGSDALRRGPDAARELIYAAMEAGVNSFHLENADPVLAEVLGQALSTIGRSLINVGLLMGRGDGRKGSERDFSAEGMTAAIDRVLTASRLEWLDIVMLEEPQEDELSRASLDALKAMRSEGRIRLLGVAGEGDVMDTYVSTNAFDVLSTPFHANSHWKIRSRVRVAREQDMAVIASEVFPEELRTEKSAAALHEAPKRGLFGFGRGGSSRAASDPLAGAGTFAFLHRTPNWTAEEICVAHALTDPSISSILVHADNEERVARLAAITERDLPPGLSAQIEMARVRMAAA